MDASRVCGTKSVFLMLCVLCAVVVVLMSYYKTFCDCTPIERDLCILKGTDWCSNNTYCATLALQGLQNIGPHGACNVAPTLVNAKAVVNRLVQPTSGRDLAFVISRYKCNTDRFESNIRRLLNATVFVYDRHERNNSNIHYVHRNKGNEAAAFLKYVVDYFDKLHEYTIFSHEEEFSQHHEGSIVDLVANEMGKPVPVSFVNINNKYFHKIELRAQDAFRKWWDHCMEPDIHWGDLPQPALDKAFNAKCCAQMVVHRDRITRHPVSFYQTMYSWIQDQEDVSSAYSGRFLEWTWHIILG